LVIEGGILPRSKVHVITPWDVHKMAKTPPLAALSDALDWWDETVHPMYEFANCQATVSCLVSV